MKSIILKLRVLQIQNMVINAQFLISAAFLIGCDEKFYPKSEDDMAFQNNNMNTVIYFNSFESGNDTVGWWGYGVMEFNNEVPANGGKQSIYISGGCVVPHTYIDLDPLSEDSRLKIQCLGKNLAIGGMVTLSNTTFENNIFIAIDSADWTFYESVDTFYLPASEPFRLSMISGGKAYSAMLVDLIKIIRID